MASDRAPVRVGLLGLGTVGSGVARTLQERPDHFAALMGAEVVVTRALVRDPARPRTVEVELTTDVADVLESDDIDIVVEVMGGDEPAGEYIRRAIEQGKHVVTANKELIAKSGPELMGLARGRGVGLMFEASVGGGIPIIAPLRRDLAANQIRTISAIINGTTNYILTRMAREGASFVDALAEAQQLGYAEPDPTNDIEGIDAAYKLAIMASLGFRARIAQSEVHREGISGLEARDFQYAEELGYAIKLLAIAERTSEGILARVSPVLVHSSHPLATVDGVLNAVEIVGDLVGSVTFQGAGAGPGPTTSAVLADVLHLARIVANGGSELAPSIPDGEIPLLPIGRLETRYYIRVTVADRPGVLARIASVLGEHDVSIAAVTQKETIDEDQTAELVITTHTARELAVQDALKEIVALPAVTRLGALLRIEGQA